jgi:hypothetical protein
MTGSGLPGCGPSAPPWLAELQRHYPALANLSPEWAARLCARGRLTLADPAALAAAAGDLAAQGFAPDEPRA